MAKLSALREARKSGSRVGPGRDPAGTVKSCLVDSVAEEITACRHFPNNCPLALVTQPFEEKIEL